MNDDTLIDWIERSGFHVHPGPPNGDGMRLWAVIVPSLGYVVAHGETWRKAVSKAIERDKRMGEL